jgi:hypothetical protein
VTWADDYALTVTYGDDAASLLLEREILDEDWYLKPGLPAEQQTDALDAEAAETVADATLEVLDVRGWPSPHCDDHGLALSSCSGVWLCDGPPDHEVAWVGRLGA